MLKVLMSTHLERLTASVEILKYHTNPWMRNLGKLIMPEVYMDVDLINALVNAYNPTTWSFHRKDMSILYTLSKNAFVKAFDL